MTDDAVLRVSLRDTSYADAAAELIAEQVITNPGQVPIEFNVEYDPDDLDPRNTYSISARIIEAGDRLAFINDTAYDVITGGNPSRVNMLLVMATPPPRPDRSMERVELADMGRSRSTGGSVRRSWSTTRR